MKRVEIFEVSRGDFRWAFHLLGYLAAHESPAVKVAVIEALESTGANYPLPTVAVEILAGMLDEDLADDGPF